MAKPMVVMRIFSCVAMLCLALPVAAHIEYYDLNQNQHIADLTAAGKTLMGNDIPISNPANWNATYQSEIDSGETWGTVTGSFASGTWSTSVHVVDMDACGWTDGLRTDPQGGAWLLGDTHKVNFANFHLNQESYVSITLVDDQVGSGYGLNPSFSLYTGSAVYQAHDDAGVDPLNPKSGFPPQKIQSSVDDGAVMDSQGITSAYRNTLTNSGSYYGQFNATGDFSVANASGDWTAVHYLTSVTGTVNPDGSWEGNTNSNVLQNYLLPPGDYIIAFSGHAQPASYATIRSATTTSPYGSVSNMSATLTFSVVPNVVTDTDGDGISDDDDNCPDISNSDQLDADNDTHGDACDSTPNGDVDADGDGIDNDIDPDDDNDTVLDGEDNCPLVSNTHQLDYDSDGTGDACGDPVSLPDAVAGAVAGDKAGASVAFAGDVNNDGYGDYVIGLPGYDVPATPAAKIIKDAGRAVVISGKTGLELMSVNGVAAKDALGTAVAGGADVDDDGFDDVLVGAPKADDAMNSLVDAGSVTVLFGPDGERTQTVYGAAAKILSGSAVALGDVDNDSHADMIIGAPGDDDLANKLTDAGSVRIFSGVNFSLVQTVYGVTAKAYAGSSVTTVDQNVDGSMEVVVGAPNDDTSSGLKDAGSVSVYYMNDTSPVWKQYGSAAKAYLGKSVASGDNRVLVGAPGDENGVLKDAGSIVWLSNNGVQFTKKFGATAKAGLGNSVAVGDVNNDGFADIIAGAWKDDKQAEKLVKDAGSVSVWSGDGYSLIDTLYGDASKDYFGSALCAGDINSDGKADLVIGIAGDDIPAAKTLKDAGTVQIVSGADVL